MNNVTAIIVNYNTPDLLKACVASIRKHYPTLDIVIVDGSETDETHRELRDTHTFTIPVKFNIGHGPGLNMGIRACETDYVLLVDSDVTIDKPGVIEELLKIPSYAYGCGQVVEVNEHGSNVEKGIRYLHPHFALINRTAWGMFPPFMNHGAPLLNTMKAKPHVVNFPWLEKYITHKGRGTRVLNPEGFKPGNWDKV